jgi:hypothetical protein
MKVLVFSEHANRESDKGWYRDGEEIRYFSNGIRKGGSFKTYYTLSFKFTFPYDNDTVYFAYGYPYTYSDLMDDLSAIEKDVAKTRFCHRKLLCQSIAGNRMDIVTITAPGSVEEVRTRRGVVISARVHPGETVGSWMMKGVLNYLTGDTSEA